jgi:hypothetical protein
MDDVEIIVKKSTEEILSIISRTFPTQYDMFDIFDTSNENHFKMKKCTYIEKKDRLLFKIDRIGLPSITATGYMEKHGTNETKLKIRFKEAIIYILLMRCICLMFFVCSLLFIAAPLLGEVIHVEGDIDIFTITLAMILLAISIFLPIYHNTFRKVEKENFIKKIKSALSGV